MTEVIWLHGGGQLIRSVRLALRLSPAEFAGLLASHYWCEVPVAVVLGWEADAARPPEGVVAAVRDLADRRLRDGPSDDLREAT